MQHACLRDKCDRPSMPYFFPSQNKNGDDRYTTSMSVSSTAISAKHTAIHLYAYTKPPICVAERACAHLCACARLYVHMRGACAHMWRVCVACSSIVACTSMHALRTSTHTGCVLMHTYGAYLLLYTCTRTHEHMHMGFDLFRSAHKCDGMHATQKSPLGIAHFAIKKRAAL